VLYGRRASKPPPGALIDWSRPLAQGLRGFYTLNEGSGPTLYDATAIGPALLISGASWASGSMLGLGCNASDVGAAGSLPTALQLQWPLTLAMGVQSLGTGSAYSNQWCLTSNNSNTSPYQPISLQGQNTWNVYVGGASANAFLSGPARATGADAVVAAGYDGATQSLYVDGAAVGSQALAAGAAVYSSTSLVMVGEDWGQARNPAVLVYWAAWWSRLLSAQEHQAIGAGPAAIFGEVFTPPAWRIFGGRRLMRRTLYARTGSRGVA
jgi:hypothetical protein